MECGSCGATIGDPPVECPECSETYEGDGDGGGGLPYWLTGEYTPTGIKILCAIELLGVIFSFGVASEIRHAGVSSGDSFVATLGLVAILFALLNLAKVVGLWSLQTWGYKIAVVLYAVGFFIGIPLLFVSTPAGIVYVLFYGGLWVYLHSKRRFYGIH